MKLFRIFRKFTWAILSMALTLSACDKNETEVDDYYENEESEVEVLLTFDTFKKQVKSLNIDGFTLISVTAGEDGDHEYNATFKGKSDNYLYIKVTELFSNEPTWMDESGTYLLDDRKTEYSSSGYIHGLTIYLPQMEAEMGVYATTDFGKSAFESIARSTAFLVMDPDKLVEWPPLIPDNHKLNGFLLEVDLGDYSDAAGFTKLMVAEMMVTDELAQDFQQVYNDYYDSYTNHIIFPNGTYMQPGTDDFTNDIYYLSNEYQRITFVYYLP